MNETLKTASLLRLFAAYFAGFILFSLALALRSPWIALVFAPPALLVSAPFLAVAAFVHIFCFPSISRRPILWGLTAPLAVVAAWVASEIAMVFHGRGVSLGEVLAGGLHWGVGVWAGGASLAFYILERRSARRAA